MKSIMCAITLVATLLTCNIYAKETCIVIEKLENLRGGIYRNSGLPIIRYTPKDNTIEIYCKMFNWSDKDADSVLEAKYKIKLKNPPFERNAEGNHEINLYKLNIEKIYITVGDEKNLIQPEGSVLLYEEGGEHIIYFRGRNTSGEHNIELNSWDDKPTIKNLRAFFTISVKDHTKRIP